MTNRTWWYLMGLTMIAVGPMLSGPAFGESRGIPRRAASTDRAGLPCSDHELERVGLKGLERLDGAAGEKIRGSAGRAATGGLSFVAGMLFDPDSASTLRGSSANSSDAFGGGNSRTNARVEAAQFSALSLGLILGRDGYTTFAGNITGMAGGHGLARP